MLGASEDSRIPFKRLKHQQRVVIGPMVFTSDFDSGNMGRIELSDSEDCEGLEYIIDVAPDCHGSAHENGYKSWFFFGLSVAEPIELAQAQGEDIALDSPAERIETVEDLKEEVPEIDSPVQSPDQESVSDSAGEKDDQDGMLSEANVTIQEPGEPGEPDPLPPETSKISKVSMFLTVRNMNNHTKLYSDGYRPWCKKPGDAWRRVPDSPQLDFSIIREAENFGIRWRHDASRGSGTTYYAFCAPFSYLDCQGLLEELEEAFADSNYSWPDPHRPLRNLSRSINDYWFPRAGTELFFRRQLLHRSLQRRRVDLLTITAIPKTQEEPDVLPQDLPCAMLPSNSNMLKFENRPIIFISARVHPGETPSQFVLLGILRFLLSDDPRACNLRERFQFKIVPMLNPDGVACGHYRTNTIGLNLNRHYDKPNVQSHEAVWAVKRCLSLWSKQSRLLF